MATSKEGDATLAPILEHGQFLGQGIDPVKRRKI
jgi:hypothetical protein